MKRTFDVAAALVGLILCAPVMLIVAMLIAVDSRGGILFRQQRIGRAFRPFQILKFRTMVADAPNLGGSITAGNDPRITRV